MYVDECHKHHKNQPMKNLSTNLHLFNTDNESFTSLTNQAQFNIKNFAVEVRQSFVPVKYFKQRY